ncbi:transcriptional regulator [Bacillus mycoides]|uniref:winged helix-turn-helix transcriptional regulator n=1 Tax=Bacillus hominis TaxID=2817478 RepID=UPI000FE35C02|nr:winged helix-turn-helix transcriptional regulator [Bacillus hominis]RWS42547.1 transcriptional regulator [Bacillus mycoides]
MSLYHLTSGPTRTGELKRSVTGITQKMFTEQGQSLKEVLKVLCDWGNNYIKQRYPNGEVVVKEVDHI